MFERTPSLDDAVQVVSRLRNDEGVDGARVYQLNEVPLTVRVEYRIEVPAETLAPVAAPAAATAAVVPLAPPIEEVVEPGAHLSVVREDDAVPMHVVPSPVEPTVEPAPEPAEEPTAAEIPAARTGDVLPDEEPPQHHRGRGMGFFSSNR
jgi:hypothetical protein